MQEVSSAPLTNMAATSHMWLLTFLRIKIKPNEKFLPSVTLATVQVFERHMWPVVPRWMAQIQDIPNTAEGFTGRHWPEVCFSLPFLLVQAHSPFQDTIFYVNVIWPLGELAESFISSSPGSCYRMTVCVCLPQQKNKQTKNSYVGILTPNWRWGFRR